MVIYSDGGSELRLVSNRGKAKGVPKDNSYFFDVHDFREILALERKRSQRSRKPLILMCLDISKLIEFHFVDEHFIRQKIFLPGIRETDVQGWYKQGAIAGILFTEIESASPSVRETLFYRVMALLVSRAGPGILFKINVTFHIYPEGRVIDAIEHYDLKYHKHLANKTTKFKLSAKIKSLADAANNLLMY